MYQNLLMNGKPPTSLEGINMSFCAVRNAAGSSRWLLWQVRVGWRGVLVDWVESFWLSARCLRSWLREHSRGNIRLLGRSSNWAGLITKIRHKCRCQVIWHTLFSYLTLNPLLIWSFYRVSMGTATWNKVLSSLSLPFSTNIFNKKNIYLCDHFNLSDHINNTSHWHNHKSRPHDLYWIKNLHTR